MKKGKVVVRSPWTVYLVAYDEGYSAHSPGRIFGVYKSMDEFKGH